MSSHLDNGPTASARVSMGEKGGPVTPSTKGGALVPGLFFMRATAL